MCMKCPVRKDCEDYRRVTKSSHGVWAGRLQTRDKD